MSIPPREQSPTAGPRAFSFRGLALKLIVLPALVVLSLALVVLVWAWLTPGAADPEALVAELGRPGRQRWPAAVQLAALLHAPGSEHLRDDAALAERLGDVLRAECASASCDEDRTRLCAFLCRALGAFRVPAALPALVEAAGAERGRTTAVRRAALEGIANLCSCLDATELRQDSGLLAVLLSAADESDESLRQRAAYALGVGGGPRAERRLESLLDDPSAEVGYNAAAGLARHGNPAGSEVLHRMLALDPSAAGESRRLQIAATALEAVRQLAAANRQADLARLESAVQRWTRDDVPEPLRARAAAALQAASAARTQRER